MSYAYMYGERPNAGSRRTEVENASKNFFNMTDIFVRLTKIFLIFAESNDGAVSTTFSYRIGGAPSWSGSTR